MAIDVRLMTIDNTLRKLSCPQDIFCTMFGVSPSRLSRAIRGVAPLSSAELTTLVGTSTELTEIAADVEPLVLDFRKLDMLQLLLSYKRQQRMRWVACPITMEPEQPEVEARP
jgi:peroxiredoxin family protein